VLKWCNAKSEKEGLVPVYQVRGVTYRTGKSDPTANIAANGYRLPSDKEWEWAARGGVSSRGYTYSGSNDVNSVAWHVDNSNGASGNLDGFGRGTWPVGQKAANELGLYDMSGNVWEWCFDAHSSYRRMRGGSYGSTPFVAAVAMRSTSDPVEFSYRGFRLVRSSGL
jgi:formylglycine-generating enzyme required for sulfatase activity